jgi:hypothetical protein
MSDLRTANCTVNSPVSGFPLIERSLETTGFCGDRRAVIQSDCFPDTEQALKSDDSGAGGSLLSGLPTVR